MIRPRPGDYGVVQTDGWVAAGIRLAERHAQNQADRAGAWANHAFLVVDDCGGIIEAQPNGLADTLFGSAVRRSNIAAYRGCRMAFSSRPLTDVQRGAIVAAGESMEGIPYNVLDIVALAVATVGAVPEPVWDRLSRGDRLICSQVVARAYAIAGESLSRGPQCRVTPAHLALPPVLVGSPVIPPSL